MIKIDQPWYAHIVNYIVMNKFHHHTNKSGLQRKLQLQELEVIRNETYEKAVIYKAKTKA